MKTKEKKKTKPRSTGIEAPDGSLPARQDPSAPPVTQTNLTSVTSARKIADREAAEKRRRLAFCFLIAAGLLIATAIGLKGPPASDQREMSSLGNDERTIYETIYSGMPKNFDRRVEGHIDEVGEQINRDRIRSQHQNLALPQPATGRVPYRSDPVLRGVPLDGEKHPYSNVVPEQKRFNRSAEAEIHTQVQMAKDLDQWERSAREAYIAEFVANARAMGYRVKIDKDYNVEYEPLTEAERRPQGMDKRDRAH